MFYDVTVLLNFELIFAFISVHLFAAETKTTETEPEELNGKK